MPTIDKLTEKNKRTVLKAIDSINDTFNINILENKDTFFNKDSQIKIRDIIDGYGDNVNSLDLRNLTNTINALMDNGMISNEDYFYALKWIAEKQKAFNVKLQVEDNKSHPAYLMNKTKKSEYQII